MGARMWLYSFAKACQILVVLLSSLFSDTEAANLDNPLLSVDTWMEKLGEVQEPKEITLKVVEYNETHLDIKMVDKALVKALNLYTRRPEDHYFLMLYWEQQRENSKVVHGGKTYRMWVAFADQVMEDASMVVKDTSERVNEHARDVVTQMRHQDLRFYTLGKHKGHAVVAAYLLTTFPSRYNLDKELQKLEALVLDWRGGLKGSHQKYVYDEKDDRWGKEEWEANKARYKIVRYE